MTVNISNATGNFEISKSTDNEDSEISTDCINGIIKQVDSESDTFTFKSDQQVGKVDDGNEMNAEELYTQLADFGLRLEESCQLIDYSSIRYKGSLFLFYVNGKIMFTY